MFLQWFRLKTCGGRPCTTRAHQVLQSQSEKNHGSSFTHQARWHRRRVGSWRCTRRPRPGRHALASRHPASPKSLDTIMAALKCSPDRQGRRRAASFLGVRRWRTDAPSAWWTACSKAPWRCATPCLIYFAGKNPPSRWAWRFPSVSNARQMNAWMMHGNGRKLMNEFYAGYNMISFGRWPPARRWVAGSCKEPSRRLLAEDAPGRRSR